MKLYGEDLDNLDYIFVLTILWFYFLLMIYISKCIIMYFICLEKY